MRCRNCHTVMMETDPQCPSCHASAARATAAAPGPMAGSNNMLKLLPIFGGAIGGAIYAGLTIAEASASSSGSSSPYRTGASGGSSSLKWLFGPLLLLGGGLFLLLAFVQVCETWKIARREPKVLTAAELCLMNKFESAPPWIAYTFAESRPIDLTVTRRRLGNAGDVQASCLLVGVDDRWLLTTVAPGFEGNNLVGRLVLFDAASSPALNVRLRKLVSNPSSLLPYEFNAVEGSSSDQRARFIACGLLSLFGIFGLWLGQRLFRNGRRAQGKLVAPDWNFHPLPKG